MHLCSSKHNKLQVLAFDCGYNSFREVEILVVAFLGKNFEK